MNNTTTVPATTTEMMRKLEDKLIEVALILEARYKKPMPIPVIRLIGRLGQKLGQASRVNNYIELNLDLCDQEHWNIILNDILPHEYCHLAAPLIYNQWIHGYDKNSGWSHGRAWKECMRVLGVEPKRTLDLGKETHEKITVRKVSRDYVYGCSCGKLFNFTSILHKRVQAGQNRICLRCKTRVVFKGYKA